MNSKNKSKEKENNKLSNVPADKKILHKYSRQEVRNFVFNQAMITGDLNNVLDRLANELLPKWQNGSPIEQRKVKEEFEKQVSAVLYGYESKNHIALMECVSERFRGSAKEVCEQFIGDFDCKTDAEKILAETAANAFMRYMDASRRFNSCLDFENTISPVKNTFLAMLSKEQDRAHRQYISTLGIIKQFKAPAIEMNIRTKNAFVAQNQQINVDKPISENNAVK